MPRLAEPTDSPHILISSAFHHLGSHKGVTILQFSRNFFIWIGENLLFNVTIILRSGSSRSWARPQVSLLCVCWKGTFIRSLCVGNQNAPKDTVMRSSVPALTQKPRKRHFPGLRSTCTLFVVHRKLGQHDLINSVSLAWIISMSRFPWTHIPHHPLCFPSFHT